MVRGLSQWTKTLSFPARVSPQRPVKESKSFHVSPSASPTSPPSPINDTMDKAPIITDEQIQNGGQRWQDNHYLAFTGRVVPLSCLHWSDSTTILPSLVG
ncbi:hypothetical protein EAG_07642 [Camponotus floridanus]|uniref:Uncharacterized protein n=1 Tax=Camponotus floridanus TaxID=104421 RepID=E2AUY0_CAMFO|nr:hypothetical protein EAG_07642 [Camponotus floridanus]